MIDALANSDSPVVPRPVIALAIDSQGGGASGLAAAAGTVAGALGSGEGQLGWTDCVMAVTLRLGFAPAVDSAELLIAQTPHTPEANLGDQVTLGLGPQGDTTTLFKGWIEAVEHRLDGCRCYRLVNNASRLANLRINQAVTETSVADLIALMAREAGVPLDKRVSGSDDKLRQTIIDDSLSLWQHMQRLAALRGYSLWINGDNRLQLANQLEQQSPEQRFQAGENVMALSLWQRRSHSGSIRVHGGSRDDSGHTLRKQPQPNLATMGDGSPQRTYRPRNLSAPGDLAAAAVAAGQAGHRASHRGTLRVPGSGALTPGAVVAIIGLPGGGASALIQSVEQRFNFSEGWVADLTLSRSDDQTSPGALLSSVTGGFL